MEKFIKYTLLFSFGISIVAQGANKVGKAKSKKKDRFCILPYGSIIDPASLKIQWFDTENEAKEALEGVETTGEVSSEGRLNKAFKAQQVRMKARKEGKKNKKKVNGRGRKSSGGKKKKKTKNKKK